ncbi:MAG: GDSL-type esterase/lipase family protein [Pseudomonadota bacterium]
MHSTMTDGTAPHSAPHSAMSTGHGVMPSMALVPVEEATHRAVASGNWSDPATWEGGVLPGEGARVLIPEGVSVTVDTVLAPEIKTLRADGTLAFATDRDTELKVDTLVTTETGTLQIGTAGQPVDDGVIARIVFADDGVIDRDWDPALISRGALLHGKTVIQGADKTAFTTLAEQPLAGSTTITLSEVPVGWRVGDEISIAGTDPDDPASDEVVTIAAIDGATITLDRALERDHVAPRADLDVHVANLTRNVEFTSENEGALNRGHVMFMHTNDVDVQNVAFQGLGRTDKSVELTDWRLLSGTESSIGPEETLVEDLGGTNVRGRYSVHFHRGGDEGEPGRVEGAVVRDDPGWAYVNHSSNVDFIGNVSHNVTGAAYNTEAGDEVGSFIGNIAIRTVNPDTRLNPGDGELPDRQEPDFRAESQDYGFQGDGFWFHGAGVTVEDNVVSGASGHAYIYWMLGLVERGLGEKLVDTAQLPNGDMIGPDGTLVRTKHVPVPSFDGNDAYGATKGLQIHYMHTDHRDTAGEEPLLLEDGLLTPVPQAYEDQLQSVFSDIEFWNIQLTGIDAPYSTRLTFEDVDLIGTGEEGSIGIKLDHFANENNFTLRDLEIEGFQTGLAAPRQGDAVIEDATIAALTDIRINAPDRQARDLTISDVTFAPLDPDFAASGGDLEERQNILLDPLFDLGLSGGLFEEDEDFDDDDDGLNVAFLGDSITDAEEAESFVTYLDLGDAVEAQNYAIAGSGITEAAGIVLPDEEAFEALLDSNAELVWIMIGGNDVDSGADAADYEEALGSVVEAVLEMPSSPEVVIAAQPPFFAFDEAAHTVFREDWVPAMQRVAEETGARFVDINAAVDDYPDNYPDLIHPNAAGAESLARLIAPEINALLPDTPFVPEEEEEDFEEDDPEGDDTENEEAEEEPENFEPLEGIPAPFHPDRITLDIPGYEGVGLFFAQQAPDFVPVPEDGELAAYVPAEIAGLTNAELQALYGISFSDALLPEGASTDPLVAGGLIGPALDPFASFPPEPDPFWAGRFDDPLEDEPEEEPGDDNDDEAALEAGDAVAKLYLVFFGRMPDAEGFGYWHERLLYDDETSLEDMAAIFAAATEFETLYSEEAQSEIVRTLFANGLQRSPDEADLAFWREVLAADNGFDLADFGLAMLRAEETQARHGESVDAFLAEMGLGAEEPDEEDIVFLEATPEADRFEFPEDGQIGVIEGFAVGTDLVDLGGRAGPEEIEVLREEDGVLLVLDGSALFLADTTLPESETLFLFD